MSRSAYFKYPSAAYWRFGSGVGLLVTFMFQPISALACAACYGQSDSPMAHGFNWGILSLLGVVGFVLTGISGFFVYLGKRSANLAAVVPGEPPVADPQSPVTASLATLTTD